jgi:uncharacterized protein YjbI with pentapeptide repeats
MAEETEHTGATATPGDAGPTPPGEPPQFTLTAAALAGEAKDLQALRDTLVDAASVGAGLWFSYLFILLYLLIAVGGVTHNDLFLESPVKLPFLNVDLPLLGFFWLGPAIFLVVHTYVLLHFVLLAGKVGDFDAELNAQIADEDVRKRLRRQLPSNIFVQFLAGSREVRTGVMGFLLRLIAQISLVIGPIALLVFFELQFLPYHNEAITRWHRITFSADIVLLWTLWPSIALGKRAGLSWRDLRRCKIVALAFASLAPVLLVTAIATFPGEWLEDTLPSLQIIPWKDGRDEPWRLASSHELLVAGDVDFAARKPKSLWSNRLVLPGFDAIDHANFDSEAKIEALSETVSLRARHLEGAVLIGAKLRKADFTAAQLQGAQLQVSDLRGAKFGCGTLEGPVLLGRPVHLVSGALVLQLQQCAHLQGASLDFASLQGASLDHAQLHGAGLFYVQLQGASLDRAQLQGASLDHAQLAGASLKEAQLQGASLWNVVAWRADARKAVWNDTRVGDPQTGLKYVCSKNAEPSTCDWRPNLFNQLKQLIAKQVPEDDAGDAMERIEKLNPAKALEGEDEMAIVWNAQARSSPASEVYEKRVTELWHATGCTAEWAPYVLRGLLPRLRSGSSHSPFSAQSPQLPALAAAFLDEEHCEGAHGLSGDEKATLKAIRDSSPPTASKQRREFEFNQRSSSALRREW